MLAGPFPDGGAPLSGDSGRMGGVLNLGGLRPNDSFNAEDSADSPGPGKEDAPAPAKPASGVCVCEDSPVASWGGMGTCGILGVPV